MKIFSILIAILIQVTTLAHECVEIKPTYKENGKFYIRSKETQDKLISFELKIKEESSKTDEALTLKRNDDLVFHIRLVNLESDKNADGHLKIENIKKSLTIEKNGTPVQIHTDKSNNIKSEVIEISIPKDALSNAPFTYIVREPVSIYINGEEAKIDDLCFTLIPVLSICFEDGQQHKNIDFGKVEYDEGWVTSSQKHNFRLVYTCITRPTLEITSENDFQLTNTKGGEILDKIPYKLSLMINGNKERITEPKTYTLPSASESFTNFIDGKCSIKTRMDHIPTKGRYKDTVTFTIRP